MARASRKLDTDVSNTLEAPSPVMRQTHRRRLVKPTARKLRSRRKVRR